MLKRWFPALLGAACALAADVTTFHNDNARTGQNLNETILTPANVGSSTFGKLFTIPVDGRVDAQPLYLEAVSFAGVTHNALYVVTEHGSAYAFDADTGAQLWRISTLKAGETPSDPRNCGQVPDEIGITSTPVISRNNGPNGTIYLVAMSKDGGGNYHQRLHALDLTTGAEQPGSPVEIQASYPGTGDNSNGTSVIFDPKQYKERAGLLLLNGMIYTSWASHCDIRPYTGWLISYSASTLAQTSVLNFTPNGAEGAVWMAGAGPAADASGNIYFLAANGQFDTTLNANGFPNRGDFGNAFMKLSTISNSMAVADYFAMFNVTSENNSDADLGSGGALILPDMTDGGNVTRHLAVGAGKDQHIYLVDRDNMGKFNAASNVNYQDIPTAFPDSVYAMPAFFDGHLYYGAVNDAIRRYSFSNAQIVTPAANTTPNTFPYPGATPSISANGNSSGIVWAVANTSTATLYAYDAANLSQLYNSNQAPNGRDQFGAGNKFMTPTIVNGKVYVGTPNAVAVFGILPTIPAPVITSPGTASGTQSQPFSYQITATNNPTSFSASGLPSGLTVNTTTGLISGTPNGRGTTTATIRATNPGGSGSKQLTISIAKKRH